MKLINGDAGSLDNFSNRGFCKLRGTFVLCMELPYTFQNHPSRRDL